MGVWKGIPKDVLLGEDALALQDRRALVVTRRQKKAQDEREAIIKQNELASGVRAIPVEELPTLSEAEESDDDFDEEVESSDESNSASKHIDEVNEIQEVKGSRDEHDDSLGISRLFDEDNLNDWKADDVNSESECNDTSHDASALDEPFDETLSDLSDISDDEESDDVTSKVSKNISTGLKCQQEYAEILRLDRDKLRELQSADLTLAKVREHADANQLSENQTGFFWHEKLLYRKWISSHKVREVRQIVVPAECRNALLRVSHDIPLSGHLGIEKTKQRLLQYYYWPGIFKDVAEYCRTCSPCQKSARRRASEKAPLISMPIINIPFELIAMDIVGPLKRTRRGNKFILVIVDYATRYPEALAMPDQEAKTVATALIEVFSRMGLPGEILTDQGTNFMSRLMTDMCAKLKISKIRTSPYHAQGNGLTERFNGTLKAMLQRFVAEDPKEWDRYLPYLLFAYREVPQASTGFSPFELMYGRSIRGPLAVIKDQWTEKSSQEENLAQYVITMRERLADMRKIVKKNMEKAQARQKRWYDRGARKRSFRNGDKVLVLLPSSTHKLSAQWQGPFTVVRKVSNVDYEIERGGRRKPKRVYHINMLRAWKERNKPVYFVDTVDAVCNKDIENSMYYSPEDQSTETWRDVVIADSVTADQRAELLCLLQKYSDVLTDVPGCTDQVEHDVITTDETPICQKLYRLPQAAKQTVKEELQKMLKAGIITESKSPYASPLVLVKKKQGGVRFCVDYRGLNKVTVSDAYPMPRPDELIEEIGGSNYISTIDLTKGYWQIPLSKRAREKSAFITPFGLYEFTVMHLG
ncbi:uncharacterized protein [Ptychodera flava]|uniref:uncharacterized protein n=1 Tax=Ptychodera flava TaxID=63121 RepID=UPI00396A7E49